MKVILNKAKNKVKESIKMLMGQLIMEIGNKMKDMDMELKKDQMQVLMKGNIFFNTVIFKNKRGMAKESLNFKMGAFSKDNFKMMYL